MNQLRILHLSDIHFGAHHRCNPEDPTHTRTGFPSLYDLLAKDLAEGPFEHPAWRAGKGGANPLIVVLTGDLTQKADYREFAEAHSFLTHFDGAKLLDTELSRRDLFLVPGNHDIIYEAEEPAERLAPYANFYSKLYKGVRPPVTPDEGDSLSQVHVDAERGFVVVEINTTAYVQKGTADAQRGNVDMRAIAQLRKSLSEISDSEHSGLVRIAILHHHPILVPALVEAGRGYDAVANSHHLLKLLREFGIHIVLHGHKHYPHVFSYDPDSPWSSEITPAMLVLAGGSAASRELPNGARRCNTYNLISIKWHPEARQARLRFITRGLITEDGGGELTPDLWRWETLREADRRLLPPVPIPEAGKCTEIGGIEPTAEAKRKDVYGSTRLNMIVSEVLPSLLPGQAYEVRAWIVPHVDKSGRPKPGWQPPERVVWSPGPMFRRKEVCREDDETFCCAYNYWGSMVLQAEMHFSDKGVAYAHTYARIPELRTEQDT